MLYASIGQQQNHVFKRARWNAFGSRAECPRRRRNTSIFSIRRRLRTLGNIIPLQIKCSHSWCKFIEINSITLPKFTRPLIFLIWVFNWAISSMLATASFFRFSRSCVKTNTLSIRYCSVESVGSWSKVMFAFRKSCIFSWTKSCSALSVRRSMDFNSSRLDRAAFCKIKKIESR